MQNLYVKICGLREQKHIDAVAELGAHLCGFIFHPKSPRHVSAQHVQSLHTHHLCRVGVFVEQDAQSIAATMHKAHLHMAQIHGAPKNRTYLEHMAECAQEIGAERIISVLWPQKYMQEAQGITLWQKHVLAMAPHCAYYLLDAGQKGGGHNAALDWQALQRFLPSTLPRPWFLAGGLYQENIPRALQYVSPWGLDINSGVESEKGQKSLQKILELQNIISLHKHNFTRLSS